MLRNSADSPTRFTAQFEAVELSFNGSTSVWDDGFDGDGVSFDMITQTEDGAVDEEVRSKPCEQEKGGILREELTDFLFFW